MPQGRLQRADGTVWHADLPRSDQRFERPGCGLAGVQLDEHFGGRRQPTDVPSTRSCIGLRLRLRPTDNPDRLQVAVSGRRSLVPA